MSLPMITVTDTLQGKKRPFQPIKEKQVLLYVCGITSYDNPHIGHGRVYVTFDIFVRLLRFLGYDVRYCRNFTDIDDKLIKKAETEFNDGLRFQEIAQRYIAHFEEDMKALGCLKPTYEPLVTQTIPEIIAFVEGLIAAGKAYVVDGDVYFHVRSFPVYGKLSKRMLDDLKAGARVDVDERKKDPLDFALWKSEPEGQFYKSPWGWGRPGWHIECSAMAKKFLGEQIDIHAGGLDLIFPHHENEIAQSEGLHGKEFAHYWMHNAFVQINKEKMSKSLNNFFTLRDVFEEFDPMVIRYYYAAHSYNTPLEFNMDDIRVAQKTYRRLCTMLVHAKPETVQLTTVLENPVGLKMIQFLCDDLNTPGMFGVMFEHAQQMQHDVSTASVVSLYLKNIIGLSLIPQPEKETAITPEIEILLKERDQARVAKDWATADAIRDKLKALGYDVKDKKI